MVVRAAAGMDPDFSETPIVVQHQKQQQDGHNEDVRQDDYRAHVVFFGRLADLEGLRHKETRDLTLDQQGFKLKFEGGETWQSQQDKSVLLIAAMHCRAIGVCSGKESPVSFHATGHVYVTPYQLWFVSEKHCQHDFLIGGACIPLHAVTDGEDDGTPPGVYLQVSDTNSTDRMTELTLIPTASGADNFSQVLFQALCRLVSMHPTVDEDDDDSEDLVWGTSRDRGGIGDGTRSAMLERLDQLLVVNSEWEILDGQFDDA